MNSIYGNTGTTLRIGGIASGLDTESIIRDLMRIEQLKVDRLYQQKTRTEWLRDDYRSIINILKDFKDTRFDVLKPDTYMLSSNAYRTYKVTSTNDAAVAVSARAGITAVTTTIQRIESLATAASLSSKSPVSSPLYGTGDIAGEMNFDGESLTLALDGVSKKLTFSKNYGPGEWDIFASDLQQMLDEAFGAGRVQVSTVVSEEDVHLRLTAGNSTLEVRDGTGGAMDALGFTKGQSNRVNLDMSIGSLQFQTPLSFGTNGEIAFEINGVPFSFSSSATLREIMSKINSSEAGVQLTYSSLTDQFILTANETGAGQTIKIVNKEGNFFGEGSVTHITELTAHGTDAHLWINNQEIYRSTNNFTIDGINYTLKATYDGTEPIVIKAEYDVTAAVEKIKGFVEQYNKVIEEINKKLSEEYFRDYPPLTEAQKDEMTEKEIELWEKKARSGLLRGDRLLEELVGKMRKALIDAVEGAGISLSAIGIKTGSYYEKGKLQLDEKILTEALLNHGEKIEKLFIAKSKIDYSPDLTSEQRAQRYQESGLMYRISDILNDYIRTTRNDAGKKGLLLEKAGIVNDVTEYKNALNEEISRIEKRIDAALALLQSKEDAYWRQFTALEKALQQMYSQSAWLMQQFGNNRY